MLCSLATAAVVVISAPRASATVIRARPGTLQAALDSAGPGDQVLLDPGTYPESITVHRGGGGGAPLTITRATASTPVITGPWQVRAPYVTVSRLIFDGSPYADYPIWVTHGASGVDGSHFTLEYSEVRNSRLSGIFIGDTTPPVPLQGVVLRGNYFHDNGTSRSFNHGISIKSGSNHVIEGNLIVRSSGFGIHNYPHAQGVVIRGNEIRDNGAGILIEYDSIEVPPMVNHTIVDGNYLKDNHGMGISVMYDGDVHTVPPGISNAITNNWASGNAVGQYGHDGTLGDSDYTRGATWSGNVYGDPPGGVLVRLSAVGPDGLQGSPTGALGFAPKSCSIRSGSARMSRSGVIKVRLRCPGAERGTLRLETVRTYRIARRKSRPLTVGRRSFSLRAGTSTLRVRLSGRGRRLVRQGRRVRMRATIAAGGSTTFRTLTVSAPSKRRRSRR